LVIAKRESHDHQGQRVFGRGVRPRVDNSDHRGQRVYEGSALVVLYIADTIAYLTLNFDLDLEVSLVKYELCILSHGTLHVRQVISKCHQTFKS